MEQLVNAIANGIGVLPGWLIMGWYWTRLLEPWDKRWFWAQWMALLVMECWAVTAWSAERIAEGSMHTIIASLTMPILMYLVFPVYNTEGKRGWRLLVVLSTVLAILFIELLGSVIWTTMSSEHAVYARDVVDHPLEYALTMLIISLLFCIVFSALYRIMARFSHTETDVTLGYFVGFLAVQVLFLIAMLTTVAYLLDFDSRAVHLVMACAVVGAVVDAVVLVLARNANDAAVVAMRAEESQRYLDECIAHYEQSSRANVHTSYFRHEFRGHLQAVEGLVALGDFERAHALVDEMRAKLDEIEACDEQDACIALIGEIQTGSTQ